MNAEVVQAWYTICQKPRVSEILALFLMRLIECPSTFSAALDLEVFFLYIFFLKAFIKAL